MTGTDGRLDRDARFEDYAQARLLVHGVRDRVIEVRPTGHVGWQAPFPFDAPRAHVVTAFDPGPDRLDAHENERRQRALVDELPDHVSVWRGDAGAADGSHREASAVVLGLSDEEAVALGAHWGQDAIFRWTPEAWSVVPCDGGPPVDLKWYLVEHRVPLSPGVALRRRTHRPDGTAETCTVAGGPEVWMVQGDGRRDEVHGTLIEVVATTPELRDLVVGTASEYELADGSIPPTELATVLRVVGDDAEDPSTWPVPEAARWDDENLDEALDEIEWRHRWVEINGERASAVVLRDRDERRLVVVEDDDHLATSETIAEFDWSSDGGGRPMSTDGGNSLGWLAPGLLYQRRWGDFGPEHHLVPVDDGPAAVARALAEWVDGAEVEQSLALGEEPLDPEGTLPEEERETLRRQLALCDISLTFPRDEVGRLARAEVAAASESYRRTRDALAQPKSEDGQALRALLSAVDEGEDVPDSVTWATWQ